MQHVLGELERIRGRTRRMLIALHVAVVLAWILGSAAILILVDFAVRLPGSLRFLLMVAGMIALAVAVMRYLWPSVRYHPSLVQIALRIERSVPALDGRLASSVEFAAAGSMDDCPLAARSVRETETRLDSVSIRQVIHPRRLLRDLWIFTVILLATVAACAAVPDLARTGVMRFAAPFGTSMWPARTAVASLMDDVVPAGVHPRGVVLPLRARNLTEDGATERVVAHYRLERDDHWQPWRRDVLSHQTADVHERLLDTQGVQRVEITFETEDASTQSQMIMVRPAPAVVTATLNVEPPAYARPFIEAAVIELGPGLDQRARTEDPLLMGSSAELTLVFNKTLAAQDDAKWRRETLGWTPAVEPELTTDGDRWVLRWTIAERTDLALTLSDDDGLQNADPIVYAIDAAQDLPPSVTMTTPEADLTVLPQSRVDLAAEATDDIAVLSLEIQGRITRDKVPYGSLNQTMIITPRTRMASLDGMLDLAPYELQVGDVIEVQALAIDAFGAAKTSREPVASTVRHLQVISELDFTAQLRRHVAAVRQNAIRIEATLAELQDDVVRSGVQPGQARAQSQLSERIAAQRSSLQEIETRLEQNNLDDPGLRELLTQAGDLLDYAGRSSSAATEALETRREAIESGASPEPEPDADRETARDEDRDIVDAQKVTRDELTDLIELLDRDEDTWVVQRRLANLLDEQKALHERTGALSRETIGRERSELSADDREALDRIADEEQDLVADTQRLVEELRRRSEALAEVDPNAASGMREAADTAERREVDQEMQKAADDVEQNRMQSATAAQQSAITALEQMVEDIEVTRKARAEELLRKLASLIESIERLITVQESEIIALAKAAEAGSLTGRDRAMIRLNQNTDAVATEARAAGRESRRIARMLDRAADSQGSSITALRARPADLVAATAAEERSLSLLKDARALAEELEQKAQEDQAEQERDALVAAYRALAEREVVLRTQTEALSGSEPLSRRDLVVARRLGSDQQKIREDLATLESSTQEIMESEIFSYIHELMDDWCERVSDSLWDGAVTERVTDRQQMIAESIGRQIEAIEDAAPDPEEFASNQQSAGGGGGGGGGQQTPPLIPPVAELKRLHGLQMQVYEETRRVEERPSLADTDRRERITELGTMQEALIRLGEAIIKKMTSTGGPPPMPATEPGAGEPIQ